MKRFYKRFYKQHKDKLRTLNREYNDCYGTNYNLLNDEMSCKEFIGRIKEFNQFYLYLCVNNILTYKQVKKLENPPKLLLFIFYTEMILLTMCVLWLIERYLL